MTASALFLKNGQKGKKCVGKNGQSREKSVGKTDKCIKSIVK